MSVAEKMTAIADAIREKTGDTEKLSLDGMAEALRKLPGPIVATASGSTISLTDATDLKLRGLKLFGKTTQNGTPTPDAPVPLVSAGDGGSLGVTVAGKNLFDLRRFVSTEDISATIEENSVTLASKVYDWYKGYYLVITLEPNAKYTVSAYASSNGKSPFRFIAVKINGVNVGQNQNLQSDGVLSVTFTTDSSGEVNLVFGTNYEAGQQEVTYSNIQLEYGATVTEYEPYKESQTIPISTPNGLPGIPVTSGGNYTDETGQQWVCDEVDFARGVYVQRVHSVTLTDDLTYVVSGNTFQINESTPTQAVYNSKLFPPNRRLSNWGGQAHAMSDKFQRIIEGDGSNILATDVCIGIFIKEYRGIFVSVGTGSIEDLKNILPITLNYELETPIETPLSAEELAAYAALHTNYPNATILNDGGAGMEVNYVADTKLYIDNKINAMAAAIVNA